MRTDTPTLDAPGRAPGAATDDELRELDSGLDALQAVDSTRRTGLAGWDWSRVLLPVAAVVLLVAIWQAFAWLAGARGEPITGPGDVVGAFGTLWAQGLVQQAVATSVGRAVVGFALAVVVGVGLGLVLGQVGVLRRAFGPLLTALMVVPNVAWVPLAVLWFGLSDATAYFVMLTGAVPAVVAGLTTGTDQVPPQLRRAARVLGASRLETALLVVLPAALPAFVSGLRQGWAFAWRGLMAAEIIAVGGPMGVGLGTLLHEGRAASDLAVVLCAVLTILAVGVLVELTAFGPVERRMLRRRGLLEGSTR